MDVIDGQHENLIDTFISLLNDKDTKPGSRYLTYMDDSHLPKTTNKEINTHT